MLLSAYGFGVIMNVWNIKQSEEFREWFDRSSKKLQTDTVEHLEILRQMGPLLGRPYADTIKGSSLTNLKELRFNSEEKVIRLFFVFDPDRNGVLLIGGNKASSGDKNFYKVMIDQCEKIYGRYLEDRRKRRKNEKKI